MIAYFYGELQIKPYINRSSGRPTTDAVALSRIAKKRTKGSREAKIILKMRKLSKLSGTYFNVPIDSDDVLRCSYKIAGTDSGRLSSASTFFGTGTNLQNQPPVFKHFLHAQKGFYLFEPDLAKAEAHVVAYLCQDHAMIEAFNSGIDIHTFNASKIFDVPMDKVSKWQRSIGKRVVHASNYKMGPKTFSDQLAKDNIFIAEGECGKLLRAYTNRFPKLPRWHKDIEKEVMNTRTLHNLFGRPKKYLKAIDGAVVRSACSYKPQSSVAEVLNRGMIKMYDDPDLWKNGDGIHMNLTVHDSVMVSLPILPQGNAEIFTQVAARITEHLTHEFIFRGQEFSIGVDGKVGFVWGDMEELPDFKLETVKPVFTKLGLL